MDRKEPGGLHSPWDCKELDTTYQLNNNKATEERQVLRSTDTKASLWEMLPNLKFTYGRINSGFPKFGKNSTNRYDNINNDL